MVYYYIILGINNIFLSIPFLYIVIRFILDYTTYIRVVVWVICHAVMCFYIDLVSNENSVVSIRQLDYHRWRHSP